MKPLRKAGCQGSSVAIGPGKLAALIVNINNCLNKAKHTRLHNNNIISAAGRFFYTLLVGIAIAIMVL